MIGLLAAFALASAQPAATPSAETRDALIGWGQCTGARTRELATSTSDSTEAILAAAFEACRELEQRIRQGVAADFGAERVDPLMADLRAHATGRMTQTIAEIRAARH